MKGFLDIKPDRFLFDLNLESLEQKSQTAQISLSRRKGLLGSSQAIAPTNASTFSYLP
jgi:hypothetical protein